LQDGCTARLLEEKALYTQHLCFARAARAARAENSLFPLDFWSAVQIPLKNNGSAIIRGFLLKKTRTSNLASSRAQN